MPTLVVEIHVPLLPTPGLPEGSYPFPWIAFVSDDEAEEFGLGRRVPLPLPAA
ncbi:hypothetical protein [Streptomyces sp. NPDC048277]|uniref:hypothetical protein n=1 Tax=Streptomyces sp. NPDC048277 TaxID=3155027 RepID=UPI0033E3A5D1